MALTCPDCGTELAAGAKFCPECGARQPEHAPASREVRKVVTVLFADVTGSTALGEQLDPEALRSLMTRYFAAMRQVIERHGGTVEKFIGDAVMAVFGIPAVHEDDALRAVRAAWEIRDALGAMNRELEAERGIAIRFRTGVNTGEVVAGDPDSSTTLVTGDTVNTAARLEQAAPPGEILLGRLTYSLVRDAVDAEPVEPIAAKGKAEPLEAYRLVAVQAGAAGRARHLDAPMVGRDRELAVLTEAWRRAVDERTPHLVTLVAPAGVGKSRLVREFIERVRQDGGRALVGRCLSYGEGITYWPVRELVHQAAGITEADTQADAMRRVAVIVEGERDAEVLAAKVAAAVGLSSDAASQDELFWAIRRILERLAVEQPTLLVLEDLHWAEETLLDLVDYVIDLAAGVPLLILGTARPDVMERRPGFGLGRATTTQVRLEPLGNDAASMLIAAMPGGAAIPDGLARRILDAAEGNPLYVEELVGMLRDDGTLRPTGDGWQARPGIEAIAIPASIQALLAARLEALPTDERAVAQRASVMGRSFEVAALAELDAARSPDLTRQLLGLVRKELLRPDRPDLSAGDAYRFRHVLIRDAAYDALAKAERAALHERFADWLERAAGDRLTELEEIVGYHFAEAARYRIELGESGPGLAELRERAGVRLAGAGRHASDTADKRAAIALLGRARELLPAGSRHLTQTLLDLRRAYTYVGETDRAMATLRAAGETLTDEVNLVTRCRYQLAFAFLAIQSGGSPAAYRQVGEEALAAGEAAGDDEVISLGLRVVGDSAGWMGRLVEERVLAERALEVDRRHGRSAAVADGVTTMAIRLPFGPWPVRPSIAEVGAVMPEVRAYPDGHATVLLALGMLQVLDGQAETGRATFAEAKRIADEVGLLIPTGAADWPMCMGIAELVAGDPARVVEPLRWSVRELERAADHIHLATVAPLLAQVLLSQGTADDEVERLIELGRRFASPGDFDAQGRILVADAQQLAYHQHHDDAQGRIGDARGLLGPTDLLLLQFEVETAAVHVAIRRGDPEAADLARANAVRLASTKGSAALMERAQAL